MNQPSDFLIMAVILISIGIYGLVVKRNALRLIFSIEIIANAVNLVLVAFSRMVSNAEGQIFVLFSIAISAAEVAVGLGIIIIAYRFYKDIDITEYRNLKN
ncbi:MAG: NADH-quinone oxidoreductase subunit NuoK [Thermoproteota archaeon]|nr:NADH-quinone oxidoreductase subunit NuoK [Thermoproteota archaeon]